MMTRKIKKTIYNTLVICLLLAGLAYVCSRFIHPGVEYTDNATPGWNTPTTRKYGSTLLP